MRDIIKMKEIQDLIFTIRGNQVMMDGDLAEMYNVSTKRLNEQVKRNSKRFPETFRFQLTDIEKNKLVANCDRFDKLKHSSVNPYAFTEQGVAMLSAVLHSDIAIDVSIGIMQAFAQMRKYLLANTQIFQKLDNIEQKQLNYQLETDQKFVKIFKALEDKSITANQGVFFEGQVFDAYLFISDIIKKATTSIILIDNYVDETVLALLSKRSDNVVAIIYTKHISKQLSLDLTKHNQQYPEIQIKTIANSHDRFLIIDNKELYHIGASLKDLGNKWFAFSKMDDLTDMVMSKLKI